MRSENCIEKTNNNKEKFALTNQANDKYSDHISGDFYSQNDQIMTWIGITTAPDL